MSKVETEKSANTLSDKDKEKDTLPRSELQNGPIQNRGCTDILCCLIFVAFIVVLVGVGSYGLSNGKPMNLLTTFDTDGKMCGKSEGYTDYPLLYIPSFDLNAANDLSKMTDKSQQAG